MWNLVDGSLRHVLQGHSGDVTGVDALTLPDETPVAVTVGKDRTVRVWDLRDGSSRDPLRLPRHDLASLACLTLPDGIPVAVVGGEGGAQVCDLRDGALVRRLGTNSVYFTRAAAITVPDGRAFWDLDTCSLMRAVTGHTESLHAVACVGLPDGTPLAVTGGIGAPVRAWDLRDGSVRTQVGDSAYALAGLSLPDRALVVIAEAEVLHVRELR